MRWKLLLVVLVGIFLINFVYAVSDTAVFQGQYYEGTTFQQGTYEFDFDVYTGEIFGDLVYSQRENLTTGVWGQWRTELNGVSAACNDTTKDYFMEITIGGNIQSPRRRLTHFNYLRKDVDEATTGDLTIGSILNFFSGGFIQELVDRFFISKSVDVSGDLNVTGASYFGDLTSTGTANFGEVNVNELNVSELMVSELTVDELKVNNESRVGGVNVCLEDGTNCPALVGGALSLATSEEHYVSFISTVDGILAQSDRYLPLGTDNLIAAGDDESSWVMGRDLTITGIVWNSASNSRTTTSAIILMKSTSNKDSFVETNLNLDIQGLQSGVDNTFNVSFSQGDLAVIKYESGGAGGSVVDLSLTLIGTYD